MTDTYRIKPLVWSAGQDGDWREAESTGAMGSVIWIHRSRRNGRFEWYVHKNIGSDRDAGGVAASLDAAKLAAESAYRDLLLAALEPVETPTVPQNQS